MATNTTNFNLSKPAYADTADIAVINSNMDKVDTALQGLGTGLAVISKSNTHVAITSGQYVYVHGHSSLAEGLYTAKSNIAANATLSTSNLTAVSGGGLNSLNDKKTEYINEYATDFNSTPFVQKPFVGRWTGAGTANSPISNNSGTYITYASSENYQTDFALDNSGNAYIRGKIGGNWGEWAKLALNETIIPQKVISDTAATVRTFTVPSSSRLIVFGLNGLVNQHFCSVIVCTSQGVVNITNIYKGADVTLASGGSNKLKVTTTSSSTCDFLIMSRTALFINGFVLD